MLDDLRNQTSFEPGDEEPQPFEPEKPQKQPKQPKQRPAPRPRRTLDQITHMKASQRFFLSVMLLITVCLLGTALLVLTGKMVLPLGF
jgi:hypothetical protein